MRSRRTVLFCLPSISRGGGGVSESARLQALALVSSPEVDVSVLTFDDDFFKSDRDTWNSVPIRAFRVFGPRSFSFSPGLLLALLRARPDVVHVHGVWQFHCLAVYLWSLATGGRYVVTPHGMLEKWIRARSPRLKRMVSLLYQNRFLRRAAGFQVLTTREVEDVSEFVRGQAVEIIPNYVAPFVHEETRPNWWRPDYQGRDVYLFLGRIHEKKGCLELCHAWRALCERSPEFRDRSLLVFCGWNDGLVGLEDEIANLHHSFGNAIFAGPQYGLEKQQSMSCATFFILPSKSEGLPMSILEAWSAGIPVIMTDECNLPVGFKRGAAIRTGPDPQTIAQALEHAFALPSTARVDLAKNGLQLLQDRYSQAGVRDALIHLYGESSEVS
ncbi:poly(glycerol-phosphate) alpha-glucosyltransferase [Ensifer adhaerens]|nr:poly(glycerol-phosphate) alpha-glucosyltransferase [Ensifer adhaerens]